MVHEKDVAVMAIKLSILHLPVLLGRLKSLPLGIREPPYSPFS